MWFEGSGKIIYDPHRGSMKTKTKWWAVVELDKELTRYYRWWVKKELDLVLHAPAWDAHISIIRGERPPQGLEHLWKKYHGQTIDFAYKHHPRQAGDTTNFDRPGHFWFVDVQSDFLSEIRHEYGFPTNWNYHLTFGRTYD